MKYRSRKNKIVRRVVFCVLALLLIGVVVLIYVNVTGVLLSVTEETMRARTTTAVNEAVFETLADSVRYEDLVTVERNAAGDIRAITSNSYEINRIARDTAYLSQKKLQSMGEEGVSIPLGAFTGIEALAGFGPSVTIRLIPVAVVTCRFVSDFESAGINQTSHRLVMDITVTLYAAIPGNDATTTLETSFIIAETVLVGKVPDTFLDVDGRVANLEGEKGNKEEE